MDPLSATNNPQGWKQFLSMRESMLSSFRLSKSQQANKPVKTQHGNHGEQLVRSWLSNFLPKKYGVTSGYIISQGLPEDSPILHYDVIIYDALESPILWLDEGEKSRAIPAEFVLGVIEVKANLTSESSEKAIKKLKELEPLLIDEDEPGERYKVYLPKNFFCCVFFFELLKENIHSGKILDNLVEGTRLKGYRGGLILDYAGSDINRSGKIILMKWPEPKTNNIGKKQESILSNLAVSKTISGNFGDNISTKIFWLVESFSMFSFDLVAMLNGTYRADRLSSFYGFGGSKWEPME